MKSAIGSITSPPASISYAVAANGSSGIVSRAESTEPTDHIIAERTQSAIPQYVAPPDGCASTATPAKPTPTPASACQGSRSRPASRRTTTHSGTEAMISEASPVGTSRSAKKSTAFAPGSRKPIRMHEPSARREMRSVPAAQQDDERPSARPRR